jgi:hypothetical protein
VHVADRPESEVLARMHDPLRGRLSEQQAEPMGQVPGVRHREEDAAARLPRKDRQQDFRPRQVLEDFEQEIVVGRFDRLVRALVAQIELHGRDALRRGVGERCRIGIVCRRFRYRYARLQVPEHRAAAATDIADRDRRPFGRHVPFDDPGPVELPGAQRREAARATCLPVLALLLGGQDALAGIRDEIVIGPTDEVAHGS